MQTCTKLFTMSTKQNTYLFNVHHTPITWQFVHRKQTNTQVKWYISNIPSSYETIIRPARSILYKLEINNLNSQPYFCVDVIDSSWNQFLSILCTCVDYSNQLSEFELSATDLTFLGQFSVIVHKTLICNYYLWP